MYDIETWMPSRRHYGETHSGSALQGLSGLAACTSATGPDRPPRSRTRAQFCYTLNNTAIACPRVLISVLELYQQPDGSVAVPDALRPYMAGLDRIAR